MPGSRWLNRTVAGAGITSALGDLCYETGTVLLPGFLAALGIPAVALGAIEGVADAMASFTKMFAGYFADRFGHRKWLVMAGYLLTPAGQALIASAGNWPLILCARSIAWFGKGLRGPLRDAIVAQSMEQGSRARAFGFHRAADTVGAVVGPSLGVLLLGWAQESWPHDAAGPFRVVLWLSVAPGLLSVMAFWAMVKDPETSPNPALRFFDVLRRQPPLFRKYLFAVGLFGVGDFSHSLLILAATQILTPTYGVVRAAQLAGALYVARNIVQVLVSYPAGYLADRFGATSVLAWGYAIGAATGAATAMAFALPSGRMPALVSVFVLGGIYVAVQEALEPTVTAEVLSAETLTTGFGALGAVNGCAKLVASSFTGFVWSAISPQVAFSLATVMMMLGTASLGRIGRLSGQSPT